MAWASISTKWPGNRIQKGLSTVNYKCSAHLPLGIELSLLVCHGPACAVGRHLVSVALESGFRSAGSYLSLAPCWESGFSDSKLAACFLEE